MDSTDRAADLAADVATARLLLRQSQRRWAAGIIADPSAASPLQLADERAAQRVAGATVDGDFVYDGVFRYNKETEAQRWERTSAVIHRADPGPDEDGGYLEFLARQAASVEMAILAMGLVEDASILDGVLLGTSGEPRSDASTSSLKGSRAAVICLSAGMVYLMYQAAKAVVLSWKPKPAAAESVVSFSARPEDTAAVLDADDAPVGQLSDTLISWFQYGIARPPNSVAPAPMYHPPLTLLTNFAERFVIAHEYCHALYDQFAIAPPPWLPSQADNPIDKELRADRFATAIISTSASAFDRMAPNVALQGAMVAMKIHEIADEAIEIVTGLVPGHRRANATHPPFDVRAAQVFEAYRSSIADLDDESLDPRALLVPAETADELWSRAKGRIEAFKASGTPLSPVWPHA